MSPACTRVSRYVDDIVISGMTLPAAEEVFKGMEIGSSSAGLQVDQGTTEMITQSRIGRRGTTHFTRTLKQ
jgi:hypothetical protein